MKKIKIISLVATLLVTFMLSGCFMDEAFVKPKYDEKKVEKENQTKFFLPLLMLDTLIKTLEGSIYITINGGTKVYNSGCYITNLNYQNTTTGLFLRCESSSDPSQFISISFDGTSAGTYTSSPSDSYPNCSVFYQASSTNFYDDSISMNSFMTVNVSQYTRSEKIVGTFSGPMQLYVQSGSTATASGSPVPVTGNFNLEYK